MQARWRFSIVAFLGAASILVGIKTNDIGWVLIGIAMSLPERRDGPWSDDERRLHLDSSWVAAFHCGMIMVGMIWLVGCVFPVARDLLAAAGILALHIAGGVLVFFLAVAFAGLILSILFSAKTILFILARRIL